MTINFCSALPVLVALLLGIASAQPPFYTDKINSIPDLTQTDPEANFPSDGKEYCLHAAVTNSLMWLDSNGFPNLVENSGNPFADQVKLAKLLASKNYMDTDPEEGTGTTNFIRGLKKYIEQRGYQIDTLEYRGWRPVEEDIGRLTTGHIPEPDWIKQGVLGNGCVWLNVGWYKYNTSKNEYERLAGHWGTLVGYGKDQNDKPNPDIIILHDPSGRAGKKFANEYVLAVKVTSGTLTGEYKGLPRSAAGFYRITDGMHIKPPADCAIIDGAVTFRIGTPISQDKITQKKQATKLNEVLEHIGAGYVAADEPDKPPSLKKNLSKTELLENFDILSQAIDRYYSFFEHKHIDWNTVTAQYRPRIQQAKTTEEFYSLLTQFVRELKDAHSWRCNYSKSSLPDYSPEITIRKIRDEAIVADVPVGSQAYANGIRRGSVVIEVEGLSVKDRVEQIRPLMKMYSSERGFLEDAYRHLLDGPKDTNVTLKFIAPETNEPRVVSLNRVDYKPRDIFTSSIHLQKGKFIWSGLLKSGYGYIRILSFEGREEIADEFDQAMEKLKDTKGLIIDIRENPGGFGTSQKRIIGRFITAGTKVNIAYERNGPDHNDFRVTESFFDPAGPWQYTRPAILLINAVTGSASDLFACRLISTGRVVTIGTATHGNLSGECVFAVLPCGFVVRISNAYISDAKGRIIETNGNVPDIYVEPSIKDIIAGRDAVLERAAQELEELCKK